MIDRNSAEYKTVMGLFNDGKIDAAQRDKLLVALFGETDRERSRVVFHVYGLRAADCDEVRKTIEAVSGVESAEVDTDNATATVVGRFDTDSVIAALRSIGYRARPKDFEPLYGEQDEADQSDITDDGEDYSDPEWDKDSDKKRKDEKITQKLSTIGKKISDTVGNTIKLVMEKLSGAEKAIEDATDNISLKMGGNDSISFDAKKYAAPFDELTVNVKYIDSHGSLHKMKDKCVNMQKVREYFAPKMSEKFLARLNELIDEKFTGVYKLVENNEILKYTVAPEE